MFIVKSLRLFIRALTAECSHRQIAAGIACGLLVSLILKGNLLALLVLMGVSSFSISLPALFFSTFLFSWLAISLDSVCAKLGEFVLTQESLQPLWIWLYSRPLVPWTDFNNTAVMGSLLLGCLLSLPAYCCILPLVRKYEPAITARIRKYRVATWLWGAEWAEKIHSAV